MCCINFLGKTLNIDVLSDVRSLKLYTMKTSITLYTFTAGSMNWTYFGGYERVRNRKAAVSFVRVSRLLSLFTCYCLPTVTLFGFVNINFVDCTEGVYGDNCNRNCDFGCQGGCAKSTGYCTSMSTSFCFEIVTDSACLSRHD